MRGCSVVLLLAMVVLFAGGCGGGGGGSDPVPSTSNTSPVALAGVDHEVNVGLPVTLDGRGSRDPEGDALTYTWTLTGKPAGSQATLSSSISPATVRVAAVSSDESFRATFLPDEPGTYEITLVVEDGQSISEPSKIILTAVPTFAATYGGEAYDAITSVQETSDGGFILLGISSSYGSSDPSFEDHVILMKTDRFGREIWSRTLLELRTAVNVMETSDGGYILAGTTSPDGQAGADLCVLRTDAFGNMKWLKTWGKASAEEHLLSFSKTTDGGYLLVAISYDYSNPQAQSALLLKLDTEGDEVWSRVFLYENGKLGRLDRAIETKDGGFAIVMSSWYPGVSGEVVLTKIDVNGSLLWSKNIGISQDYYFNDMFETNDQGFILAGRSYFYENGLVIRTDSEGDQVWKKFFDWQILYQAKFVFEDSDGVFLVCGRAVNQDFSSGFGFGRIGLVKIDDLGNEISHKSLGILFETSVYKIIKTSDGGYLLSGSCSEFGQTKGYMLLIKTDPNGNVNPMAMPIPDVAFPVGASVSVDLSQYFSDPNGDPLSYKVAGLPDGLLYDEATGRITGTIPAAASSINYPLAVTVTDPGGLIASQTMILQVTAH